MHKTETKDIFCEYWKNKYRRKCPQCKNMLTYTVKHSLLIATRNKTICKKCQNKNQRKYKEPF